MSLHRRKLFIIGLLSLAGLLIANICFSSSGGISGLVIDKETGLPIEDVVIVRSWNKVTSTPAGRVSTLLDFQETNTDREGKFILSTKILPSVVVPFVTWIEENRLIAYKPGYKFYAEDSKKPIIELEKVAETYYFRYEQLQEASGNYEVDESITDLLKEVIDLDEAFIRRLPKFLPGVFYISGSINDMDFDKDGNIYLVDNHRIQKITKEGELLKIGGEIYFQITSNFKPIDIEFDKEGNLYAFAPRESQKINLTERYKKEALERSPIQYYGIPFKTPLFLRNQKKPKFADIYVKAEIVKNDSLFIMIPESKEIESYDLDWNKRCEYSVEKDYFKFIDIASDLNGYIYLLYSNQEKDGIAYRHQNGILKLDQNCNPVSNNILDLDSTQLKSLEPASNGNMIIAAKDRFYIYNRNYQLLSTENLMDKELGEIDIHRIKIDRQSEHLYLIDKKYNRILKYNLKNKELVNRKESPLKDSLDLTIKTKRMTSPMSGIAITKPPIPTVGMGSGHPPRSQGISNEFNKREKIKEELLVIGRTKSADRVITVLNDKDPVRRSSAAWALGEIKDQKAVNPLINVLKDKDSLVKRMSVEALGKLKNPNAVNPLIAIAMDKNNEYFLRRNAVKALGEIADTKAAAPLITLLKENHYTAPISKGLDNEFRVEIIRSLGEIKNVEAVQPLIALINNEDPFLSRQVAVALGKLGDPRAIDLLIGILKNNKDSLVQREAAEALAKIGKPSAKPLIGILNDDNYFARGYASFALGEIRETSAVEPLIHVLKDKNLLVRAYAAEALGKIGDERAINGLVEALKDKEPGVRENALLSLQKIGPSAIQPLIKALHEKNLQLRLDIIAALGGIGKPSVIPLINLLKDNDLGIRMIANWFLEKKGDECIELLLGALRDNDLEIRYRIIDILGKIKNPQAVEPLIIALKDNSAVVRWKAAEALGKIKDPKAIEALKIASQDNDQFVRKGATWAIGTLHNLHQ
jgi:HEAT repeat protein